MTTKNPISKTSYFGLIPFGLQVLILVSDSIVGTNSIIQWIFLAVGIFGLMFICGYSWVAIFPRWTIPALGFSFLFTVMMAWVSFSKSHSYLSSLWMLLPIILAYVAGFSVKQSFKPLYYLFWLIKADKSLILFWFYGFLPTFILILFDEIHDVWLIPIFLLTTLINAIGAFFYLQSSNKSIRIIALFLGAFVSFAIAIIYMVNYWVVT